MKYNQLRNQEPKNPVEKKNREVTVKSSLGKTMGENDTRDYNEFCGHGFRHTFSIKFSFNEIVTCRELFCVVTLLARATNHDDDDADGNEKINKRSNKFSKL